MSAESEARDVARRMLRDPQFRYEVEAALADEQGAPTGRERRVGLARALFEIGEREGEVWIWINGLNTYGVGDSFVEAYHDALDEIGFALQELWEASR